MSLPSLINKNFIVLSLGGSLIYPSSGIDTAFLRDFNKFIREQVVKGKRFIIVCGGGRISRNYQKAGKETLSKLTDEDVDWLGIHATRMNAQLLRTIFTDICHQKIIYHYDKKEENVVEPILVAAGWKPGWSTDYCATLLARDYKAKTIINLSNIVVLYDKDPNKFDDAKPIEKISWEDFSKLVGDKWTPGANTPFDPIATKLAKDLNITVYIAKGSDLKNLGKILEGKPFKGTIVSAFKLDSTFYNQQYFELGIGYKGYTTTWQGKLFAHLASIYRALTIKIFLNPETILDVGCGTGLLVYYLRRTGIDAKGEDISAYALSKASPSVRPFLQFGSIMKLPYSNNNFEVVTTFNILEHLNKDNLKHALNECYRVRTKYCLHKIYTTENSWMKKYHGKDISHISVFSKSWWIEFFHKAGYNQSKKFFLKLPSFMETVFLIDKKTK